MLTNSFFSTRFGFELQWVSLCLPETSGYCATFVFLVTESAMFEQRFKSKTIYFDTRKGYVTLCIIGDLFGLARY